MNAEFGERLSSGTVDREVRGVRAVAESAAGGVFQEFGEDVSLTDVAAVFAGCGQFRDPQRVGGDDGNREPHVAGVLDGSFAFGRSHMGAGNVQQHHVIAQFGRCKSEEPTVEPAGVGNRHRAVKRSRSDGVLQSLRQSIRIRH